MAIRRSMAQMVGSQFASLAVGAAGIMVLARIVSPEGFGLFAIATTIYLLCESVVNFGLPELMVRERDLPREALASATGLTFALALALSGVGALAALSVPDAIGPEAPVMVGLLALSLFTRPVLLPLETAYHRALRFGALSLIGVFRTVVDVAVAIALALAGFDALALVAGFALSRIASTCVLFAIAPAGSRVAPSFAGWRRHLRDGSHIAVSSLLHKLGETALVSGIGGLIGVAALGIYNRAERVGQLFDNLVFASVRPTILPAMARALHQDVPAARIYHLKVTLLSGLCWPAFALIAVLADPLVAVILGEEWQMAVLPLQIIAVGGLAAPFTKMSMKLFVALGLAGAYLKIQAIHQASRMGLGIAAAFVSLEAVIGVLSASLIFKAVLVHARLQRATGADGRELSAILADAALISATTVAAPLGVMAAGLELPAVAALALGMALGGLGWLVGLALTRHALLREIAGLLRHAAETAGRSPSLRGGAFGERHGGP